MDWIIFERKIVCKALRGFVGTREELMEMVKTQKVICDIKNILYYQYQEKGTGLERCNKVCIKMESNKAFFPHEKFHIGSTIKKFDFYIRFLCNYSKKYYAKIMKERCGILKKKKKYDHTSTNIPGFEVIIDISDLILKANESAISVRIILKLIASIIK